MAVTSGPLTVLTGFLLIWKAGGFGNVPRRIHIGLALSLVAGNVSQFVTGATVVKIERLVQAGHLDAARALVPRFVKSSYVVEGLLLVTMALMVLRF